MHKLSFLGFLQVSRVHKHICQAGARATVITGTHVEKVRALVSVRAQHREPSTSNKLVLLGIGPESWVVQSIRNGFNFGAAPDGHCSLAFMILETWSADGVYLRRKVQVVMVLVVRARVLVIAIIVIIIS